MPRLKTESEVSTLAFLRERTSIPVPEVLYYDSNPWNRLGGEFIVMTKVCHPLVRYQRSHTNLPLGSRCPPFQSFPYDALCNYR